MNQKILDFLASKWFRVFLLAIMALFIPTTYHNFSVVWDSGRLWEFKMIIIVFACNVLGVVLAFWKVMDAFAIKEQTPSISKEW